MTKWAALTAALLGLAGAWMPCSGQDEGAPPPEYSGTTWSGDQLDQMLGPIALYPDPLIGLILPASTEPSQVVAADRYLQEGGDPSQVDQQPWDPSVQGLAHYPDVLKWMDDNLTWTTQLGEAFANQQADVMDSIQRLRARAQSLGNLPSTPQETVTADDGNIDIEPANPDEIYVPDYSPSVIYDDPGVYCSFGVGFPIGVWLGFDWDWRNHHLIHWGPGHERPRDWWRRPPDWRRKEIESHPAASWRPRVPAGQIVDRGYAGRPEGRSLPVAAPAPRGGRPETRPVERPVTEAPRVRQVERPPAETRAPVEREAPAISRPVQRSEPESVFGGGNSSREVRAASSRGAESRSSGGFSGGGGGGGGSRGGGGNRR